MTQFDHHDKTTFKAGDLLIKQGEEGDCAYIIEEGSVEIYIEQKDGSLHKVGSRGPGSIVGEMAIVDNGPRVATVSAIEDCRVIKISRDDFSRKLTTSDPVLQMIMQVILTRYRDMLARTSIMKEDKTPFPKKSEQTFSLEGDTITTLKITNDFQEALENKGLSLHYQPIINLANGSLAGFEALMRWEHPERGFISPAIFIPIIEDSGLILEASAWALDEACRALKRIESRTGYNNALYMSVNFSATDFAAENFVDSVYNTLSATDVQAQNLCLEITERILMGQPDNARETLEMCSRAGMRISIDDFGTGYSSLSYLHYFPIQTLKIDRSFIIEMMHKEQSLALVRSIISLGKSLNMKVIAEGVENREEAVVLKEMGCDAAQGYYFARPQSEVDMIRAIQSGTFDSGEMFAPAP